MHLQKDALQYFLTTPVATQIDFNLTLTALRTYYCNPNLTELHMIELEPMKFDQKTMKPDAFLVKLQTLAKRALPDPIPLLVAPAGSGAAEVD